MGNKLCKPCGKRYKKIEQAGSVLDRVISQASNEDQCLLYKLANYKKGGELIDAYNQGGQIEVEKLIKEQFGVLLYNDGKGQIINRAEYLRWKFRDQKQVVLPIEASLSRHDPLAKWSDHEACWQMQYRGSLGETLLHVLIICDTRIHTKLARTLLKCFPKQAVDVVEGEEYLGASALHLAIAYNNNELVQDLVEAGANVNQRAIGSFFLPRDQQRSKPTKTTDYEGLAYLGEYPLAWAACCANESVYNLLLEEGASPDLQDTFGNMILHMVVVCDKLDMFGYALRHPKLPASNGILNRAGLTPLTLACKLGRAEVFREMLELSAKEFWRYSNITCSAYPLNALDTLLPDGRTNWNSALFIILNGTKEEHLDMLDGGIIQKLLEEKWKTYARNQFLKRLLILMVHLLCLSLAVYFRPEDPDEPLLGWSEDPIVITRYGCEIGTLIGVLSYVVFQQGDEIKNQGLLTFLKQQSHAPAKAIFLVSNLLLLACIPYRLIGDKKTEEAILVFAVPGSWFLLMFFAGAVRLTGPFVTMVYSMITGDMLTFGIIYTIVLFGFSQSFYFLYKGFPGVKNTLYNNYLSTWMALFQITLGDYNYSDLSMTTYPAVSKSVFAIFMVFVPILLLNMLIAMMGNTYAHVIEQSEKEWMKQWAKIVVTLERAVPQADAHHYLQEYSIKLGPGEEPGTEQRGVMIIKSKNKTRAKQRKGAVANWKRVGKVTITALRKRGLTGEQLRCIMWGRESISTPVKATRPPIMNPTLLNPDATPNITGGFGGSLTAALDVMAFTHDLNIGVTANPKSEIVLNNKPLVDAQSAQNQNISHMNVQNTIISGQNLIPNADKLSAAGPGSNAIFGMLNQLADSQVNPSAPSSVAKIQSTNLIQSEKNMNLKTTQVDDPLRELVISSTMKDYPEEILHSLAIQAANIEANAQARNKAKSNLANQMQSCFGDMFAIGATITAKSKFDEARKKQYTILDPSDSDGFEDIPLGKISRQRRARSASARYSSAKLDRSKILVPTESETSASENDVTTVSYEQMTKEEEDDYATIRIRQVKESFQATSPTHYSLRPTNIDLAIGLPINTSETLCSEMFVSGDGNGIEVEAGDISKKLNNLQKRKKRPKTARTNKVTPEINVSTKHRRHSAKTDLEKHEPESPPDPLEPWSTRPIANMNTILAWENEID